MKVIQFYGHSDKTCGEQLGLRAVHGVLDVRCSINGLSGNFTAFPKSLTSLNALSILFVV